MENLVTYKWLQSCERRTSAFTRLRFPASCGQGFFENFLSQVVYNPILSLVKISALIFLLRLGGTRPRLRVCMKALLRMNVLQIIVICLVVIFQCHPISHAWDTEIPGTCLQLRGV